MTLDFNLLNRLIEIYPNVLSFNQLLKNDMHSKHDYLEAFRTLENRQFPVAISSNGAYLTTPMVSRSILTQLTNTLSMNFSYIVKEIIPSTNSFALEKFSTLKEGDVILTHHQTKGKGRLGREWSSSIGKSVALSIVLHPKVKPESLPLFTQLTAAALCESLKKYGDAKIKWPNDILINKKKIAGILIESQFQDNQLQGLVIGVGINTNLTSNDFDETLLNKASSLKMETSKTIDPNELIADFLASFDSYYNEWLETQNASSFINLCKKESVLMGREINVFSPKQQPRQAIVKDINTQGELMVLYHGESSVTPLKSLDFSIRSNSGYS